MINFRPLVLSSFRLFVFSFYFLLSTLYFSAEAAQGRKAMVATADPAATTAALKILQRDGNAVDAAIAAQWVLNVIEPQSSGIGGGAFFLYYDTRNRKFHSFDGREAAPAEAFPEMFLDERGRPYPFKPDRITGGLPVGVPGVLKMLKEVHKRYGSKNIRFENLFQPAINLAEKGFPVTERLARFIEQEKDRLKLFPESRRIFFDEHGGPLQKGDVLFQYGLARTFRKIQQEGIEVFYQGEIAEAIVHTVRHASFHPGFMKLDDLKHYEAKERPVLHGTYRDYDIYSMGPPSSGGTTVLEALNILEQYDLAYYGAKTERYHLMAEAQYLAFEDRSRYLGDPDFSKIAVDGLISKKFAQDRSQGIQFEYALASPSARFRTPVAEGTHTSHISIIDAEGNMVAFTTTIEDVFGSAMAVPEWGFLLNNELTDFEAEPYVSRKSKVESRKFTENTFDFLPSTFNRVLHPNAAEGDKRPRSSMTPTFVFKQGRPILIVGSPGGSTIIGTVLNIIVNVIDFRMSLMAAMRSPKIIHRGESVELEPPLYQNESLRKALEKLKHKVVEKPFFGNAQAILIDDLENKITGESDPRGEGQAAGF